MLDIHRIRKSSYFGVPLFIILFFTCIFVTKEGIIKTIYEINSNAAIVRIWPTALFAIFCIPLLLGLIILLILKSIPYKEKLHKKLETFIVYTLILCILSIPFCLFIIVPLQNYAMPNLGYSLCNILKGHPNIHFTDWVKNPDWCVRGKSREWIKEQAKLVSILE